MPEVDLLPTTVIPELNTVRRGTEEQLAHEIRAELSDPIQLRSILVKLPDVDALDPRFQRYMKANDTGRHSAAHRSSERP
jgi:hypothetical protein